MGFTRIDFCDMCGKRTNKVPYILALLREYKKPYSKRTIYTKRLCEPCGRKLSGFQFQGDLVSGEIERKIDEIKLNHPKVLPLVGGLL